MIPMDFDPTKKSVIQVEASIISLGAVRLQVEKPIVFATKVHAQTKQRSANIECELLAVVFVCERFRIYI